MATLKLRNITNQSLEVDVLGGATVHPDCVVEFEGHLVDDPAELAEHLDLPLIPGSDPPKRQAPNWADDVIHAWVERVGHILAFPKATWQLETTAAAPKRTTRKGEV